MDNQKAYLGLKTPSLGLEANKRKIERLQRERPSNGTDIKIAILEDELLLL